MRFLLAILLALVVLAAPLSAQTLPGLSAPAGEAETAPPVTVDDLIRLLEDEKSRNELLQRLRAQPATDKAAGEAEDNFARKIAEYTRGIAEQASGAVATAADLASDIGGLVTGTSSIDTPRLERMVREVALVALALFGTFLVLRLVAAAIKTRIARHAEGRGWITRTLALLLATATDLGAVLLSAGTGYLIAIYVIGSASGRVSINQTLLLNAFLLVEIIKVGMRALLAHQNPPLRLIPMGDTTAAYWYFWTARLVSLVGYTFMFVAPVVAATTSYGAAHAVRVVVMLTATVIGVVIVLQNRDSVRHALTARSQAGRTDALSRSCAVLGRYWHLIAIAYLIAVLFVWLTNPEEALPYMLRATLNSLIATAAGAIVISFIRRFVTFGMRVPDDIRARLPLLQARLNAFVPRVMQVVRTIVLIGVLVAIAHAWGVIDFLSWITSDRGQDVATSFISAFLIVLIGIAAYIAMSSWVEYRLNPNYGTVPTMREKTLLSLFRNAFTIALVVMVLMLTLAQIGVNIAPLLAGAGVVGLAIGFGAQRLVQDIITGAFIQFENVMNEGDVVEAGGQSGVVEKLTIRSVSIRSLDGTLHLIPFSSVEAVSNMMRGFSYHLAEIRVAYREAVSEVKEAMHEAFALLKETEYAESIIDDLEMHGVTEFTESAVIVRARIKTMPGVHWATGRAYNEILKEVFDKRGIEIPYPHLTLYAGQGKNGNAPALPVAQVTPPARTRKAEVNPGSAKDNVSPQPAQDGDAD